MTPARMPAQIDCTGNLHNDQFTISGSVLCTHLSRESRVPHHVFQGRRNPKCFEGVLQEKNEDGQSQSEH